ncbi:MAG: hypothetical protein LUD02_00195 [Tannerellaceae bacterium]|nr:hypothetical protein [Tannerellaceae bacterium]MCD8262759.1 hypothetical protein [Tannerellaceae bacterium]
MTIGCFYTYACTPKEKQQKDENNKSSFTTATLMGNDSFTSPSDTGYIDLDFHNGEAEIETVKQKNQTIYLTFNSGDHKKVRATLTTPDSLANVRFNRIYLPDGDADGPFGCTLEYEFPEAGNYEISIHENMMAGEPWSGRLKVKVTLE